MPPISPSEVEKVKTKNIPELVFEVFNELIARGFDGYQSTVSQKDVVEILLKKGIREHDIYEKHYLDVEGSYRETGWKVRYDKPGYNESYDPCFIFSKIRCP